MIRAVVFDVFGTLLRSVDLHGPYFKLSKLVPGETFLLKRHEMMTTAKTFDSYVQEGGATPEMLALKTELQKEIEGITIFDDVSAYLDSLRWKGFQVAACSNLASAYGPKVRELIADADHHFFSYELGLVKPDPAIYAHAANAMAVKPEECLFVGDSNRSDVEGPRKAGMQSLKIERHRFAPPIHVQVDAALGLPTPSPGAR
jgi:HAD superfamily hydrolase (TIGR01549 family)